MNSLPTLDLAIADSFRSARDRFLNEAAHVTCPVTSYLHPAATGIDGEQLACDVVTVGDHQAAKVLIVSSGVHGIEGYCGNAIQCALLNDAHLVRELRDIRLVLVHALNPHGFSHFRRVNEDNVDLNRNFRDFSTPLPEDREYQEIRSLIYPEQWRGSDLKLVIDSLRKVAPEIGERRLQNVLTRGQYAFPGDPFFGGHRATWSRNTWSTICTDIAKTSEIICHVDVHTGLGESGACEIIYASDTATDKIALAKRWFGQEQVRVPGQGESLSSNVSGFLGAHMSTHCASEVSIAMEFGTVPLWNMIEAVIADNWLAANPNQDVAQAEAIHDAMKRGFFSRDRVWLDTVGRIGGDVIARASAGLRSFQG